MSTKKTILACSFCGVLAACGDTAGEQAIIGGAAGAGVAAVTSGSLVQGAAVGAAANVVACQTNIANCD